MGGGGKYDYPDVAEVEPPDPVAPASPASRGSEEVAQAGAEEKARARANYGRDKTILSRGQFTTEEDKDKLGG